MYYILGVVIVLTALFSIRNMEVNILNPILLYILIWGGMCLLYLIPLFSNFKEINLKEWGIILATIVTFVIGSLFGSRITNEGNEINYHYSKKKLQISTVWLVIIEYIAFLITVYKLGLPPLLGGSVLRVNYYVGFVEQFFLLIFPLWFLSIYLIYRHYKVKTNVIIIIFSILPVILKGNKFPFVFLLALLLFFVGLNRKIRLKYLVNIILIVVGLFYVSSLLLMKDSNNVLYYRNIELGYISRNGLVDILVDPILYITNNLMNITTFFNLTPKYTFGIQQLSGVFHSLRIDNILFSDSILYNKDLWDSNLQYAWLTTGTYLKTLFMDWGILGLLVGPLGYGLLAGYFSRKTKNEVENISLIALYIAMLIFYSILISFFTNYFEGNEFFINVIVIFLIHRYSRVTELGGEDNGK